MNAKLVTEFQRKARFYIACQNGRKQGPQALLLIAKTLRAPARICEVAGWNYLIVELTHNSARPKWDDVAHDLGRKVSLAVAKHNNEGKIAIWWAVLP